MSGWNSRRVSLTTVVGTPTGSESTPGTFTVGTRTMEKPK